MLVAALSADESRLGNSEGNAQPRPRLEAKQQPRCSSNGSFKIQLEDLFGSAPFYHEQGVTRVPGFYDPVLLSPDIYQLRALMIPFVTIYFTTISIVGCIQSLEFADFLNLWFQIFYLQPSKFHLLSEI